MIKKNIYRIITALVAIFVALELILRICGFGNFIIYRADPRYGYIPAPSQFGSFEHRYFWTFNSLSMGTLEYPAKNDKPNILLIGDSLVMGGLHFDHHQTLGPLIQKETCLNVWPISAESWSLQNELAWLSANKNIMEKMDQIIFVSNSEDFDEPSSWRCEYTHPTHKPLFLLPFIVHRVIFKTTECGEIPQGFKIKKDNLDKLLIQFRHDYKKKVVFFIYPKKSELIDHALFNKVFERPINLLERNQYATNLLTSCTSWKPENYRDEIHPNLLGNQIFAHYISQQIQSTE